MLRLPLDIWHGDDQSFINNIEELLEHHCPNKILSNGQLQSMDDNDFAFIVRNLIRPWEKERFFPRHDGKHALISLMSLIKRKNIIPEDLFGDVAGKIIISIPSNVMNIPMVKKIIMSLESSIPKTASHGAVELLSDQVPVVRLKSKEASYVPKTFLIDTGDQKYVPIDTPEQIKEACQYFKKEASTINPNVYEHAYYKISNQIKKLNMSDDILPKYATSDGAKVELLTRASLCKKAEKKYYYELFNNIDKISTLKLASAVDALDRETGLIKQWGRRIKYPHEAMTENIKLSYYVYSDPSSKNKLTEDDLMNSVSDKQICKSIEKYLGDYFVSEYKLKPVDTFKHLPDKYKGIILNIIHKKIKPEISVEVEIRPTNDDIIGSAGIKHPDIEDKDNILLIDAKKTENKKEAASNSLQDLINANKPVSSLPDPREQKTYSKNQLEQMVNKLITPPGVNGI